LRKQDRAHATTRSKTNTFIVGHVFQTLLVARR
jgi:hypothetical protein